MPPVSEERDNNESLDFDEYREPNRIGEERDQGVFDRGLGENLVAGVQWLASRSSGSRLAPVPVS